MASPMDPMTSFSLVHETIPQWLLQMDVLSQKVDEQVERFTQFAKPSEVKLTRRKFFGSTESLRAVKDQCTSLPSRTDENIAISGTNSSSPAPSQSSPSNCPSPDNSKKTHLSREPQRKRKSSSIISDGSSRDRHRNKSMVVVNYSSTTQAAFEDLVKSIATARNFLRKGRNAATFQARLASFGMAKALSPPIIGDSSFQLSPEMTLPTLGKPKQCQAPGAANSTKGFIQADRDLEEAQNLCEHAAYQMLRDGDCRQELQGMRKRFSSCAEITKREVERLQREADPEAAIAETARLETPVKVLPPYVEEKAGQEMSLLDEKISLDTPTKVGPPPIADIYLHAAGAIEVDDGDSDDESIHIDMDAIRRTIRRVPRV